MINVTRNSIKEEVMAAGLTDEALLSGDLNTVERLVYNNEAQVEVNFSIPPLSTCTYAIIMVLTMQRSV